MRIQQVIRKSGLSKRAIHHYIKEKLITPAVDPGNGYYIFSDEDIRRLTVIRLLRALNLSVADIRNILDYPKTANYYLTKVLRETDKLKILAAWKEECAEGILEGLDQESTWEQLYRQVEKAPLPPGKDILKDVPGAIDARMLSLYLLGNYVYDLEMTEYRRYLWSKLLKYIATPQNKHLIPICEFLYSLDSQKIQEVFVQRNNHMDYIASLTPKLYEEYVDYMAETIHRHIRDPIWVKSWKRAYEPYLLPSIMFYVSPASELMKELSPRFSSYVKNINICCAKLRGYLLNMPEGQPLLKEMQQCIGGYMEMDKYNYGVLESMISFEKGMF